MGFRLVILAAMGLGALYMMHLLAQDYDKIRRPITKAVERALRGKRDVHNDTDSNEIDDNSVDWKSILKSDPFSCLQLLICEIMSGAEGDDSEAIIFKEFLSRTISTAPETVTSAYARGLAFKGDVKRCSADYPFCWYSAKTMLRILRWFS